MKKIFSICILLLFLAISLGAIAQPPPPPSNPSNLGNQPVGSAAAPVGNGIGLLIALSALYGAKKLYSSSPLPNPPT
jgi:hypothetical protein